MQIYEEKPKHPDITFQRLQAAHGQGPAEHWGQPLNRRLELQNFLNKLPIYFSYTCLKVSLKETSYYLTINKCAYI